MSETAVVLGELLDSAEGGIDGPTSYLIGQLAAELVTSAPDTELGELIVTTHQDRQAAPMSRESLFPMLSGLLQGVLSHRQYAGRAGSPLTVRERVLNLLAIEPRNPKSLSSEIGCSVATASRALSRLRESELVERTPNSEHSDGRYVMYQLTETGERRQDNHFFGLLGDDDPVSQDSYEDDEYDYGQSLARLTQLVAELSKHDPVIASGLYPTLELLKDQVDDPQLRAEALGGLSVLARSKPDLVSAEQSRSWVDELLALASEGSPLIAGRAHYERARWAMRYESTDESGIEDDLTTAQEYAAAAGGPDGADLHAWCLYQRSSWAALRWDWTHASRWRAGRRVSSTVLAITTVGWQVRSSPRERNSPSEKGSRRMTCSPRLSSRPDASVTNRSSPTACSGRVKPRFGLTTMRLAKSSWPQRFCTAR